MKKFLSAALSLIFVSLFSLLLPANVEALIVSEKHEPAIIYQNSNRVVFTFTSDTADTFRTDAKYLLGTWDPSKSVNNQPSGSSPWAGRYISDKVLEVTVAGAGFYTKGEWKYRLWRGSSFRDLNSNSLLKSGVYYVHPPGDQTRGIPSLAMDNDTFETNTSTNLYIKNVLEGQRYSVWFDGNQTTLFNRTFSSGEIDASNDNRVTLRINTGSVTPPGTQRKVCMTPGDASFGTTFFVNCDYSVSFTVTAVAPTGTPNPIESNEAGIPSGPPPTPPPPAGPCEKGFCDTAFGDIEINPAEFITRVFGIILSLAGGIALILIIVSGYRLMVSQGNPEKVQAAREQLTSAVVGLLFIIFSIAILQIIGVDILKIPGFGG